MFLKVFVDRLNQNVLIIVKNTKSRFNPRTTETETVGGETALKKCGKLKSREGTVEIGKYFE